jgi:hypothetical protein
MRLSHTVLSTAALAFGLAFAASISAGAKEPARVFRHTAHVSRTMPRNATALVGDPSIGSAFDVPFASPSPRAAHVPETDGLSRNVDDCKFGCIDNGP